MKKYLSICLFLFLVGCNQKKCCTVIDAGIRFVVENNNGENMFLPNTPNAFLIDSVRLFYVVNGKIQEVYNPSRTNPRNVFLVTEHNPVLFGLSVNIEDHSEYTITYLRWSAMDTDTIVSSINRDNGNILLERAWFNEKALTNFITSPSGGYYYKIVK